MKSINYQGLEIKIYPAIKNPNGRKTRTALIYKDGQPISGVYADVQLENLASKTKLKIKTLMDRIF